MPETWARLGHLQSSAATQIRASQLNRWKQVTRRARRISRAAKSRAEAVPDPSGAAEKVLTPAILPAGPHVHAWTRSVRARNMRLGEGEGGSYNQCESPLTKSSSKSLATISWHRGFTGLRSDLRVWALP